MLPPASPFQRAIDYRQSFAKPEPAVQTFNPFAKMMEMFKPRVPQQPEMTPAPMPAPPPYGAPPVPRPAPGQGLMGRMGDSGMGEILMALGTGIASNNLASGASMLPGLMERAATRKQGKKDLMQSTQSREQLAQMLEQKGETDLAAGVRGGYIDPEDAFNTYLDNDKAKKAEANKPVKDEFGIERNPDGSFRNPRDEKLYEMKQREYELGIQEKEGKVSKERLEFERLQRESAPGYKDEKALAAEEKAKLRAEQGLDGAYKIKGAISQGYGNLGFDPENPTAPNPHNNTWIPDIIEGDGVTGLQGQILRNIGGTRAGNLAENLGTIKAQLGFAELQKMRESSPTGGALGPTSDFEVKTLQSTFTSLEQAQTRDQLIFNMRLLDKYYDAVINGVPGPDGVPRKVEPADLERIRAEVAAELKGPAGADMSNPAPAMDPETQALIDQYAPQGQ